MFHNLLVVFFVVSVMVKKTFSDSPLNKFDIASSQNTKNAALKSIIYYVGSWRVFSAIYVTYNMCVEGLFFLWLFLRKENGFSGGRINKLKSEE
jgi:hypothetical protein